MPPDQEKVFQKTKVYFFSVWLIRGAAILVRVHQMLKERKKKPKKKLFSEPTSFEYPMSSSEWTQALIPSFPCGENLKAYNADIDPL